jgi:hypothetical protein
MYANFRFLAHFVRPYARKDRLQRVDLTSSPNLGEWPLFAHSGRRIGSRRELLYCTFVWKVVWETNQAVSRDSFETRRSVIHSRTSTSAKVGDQLKSKSAFV